MSLYTQLSESIFQLEGMIRDVKHTIDRTMERYESAPELNESRTRISLILEEARLHLRNTATLRALKRVARLDPTSDMFGPRSDVIDMAVVATEKTL